MERILIKDSITKINETIVLNGWVSVRRDHGKIIFIDFRDRSGVIQCVVVPQNEEAYKIAETLRPEWVLEINGVVKERPEKMINLNVATGKIEIEVLSVKVLNEAKTSPFEISGKDGYEVNEETRLKYRYLDLRRERLLHNLILRHKVIKFIRDFLDARGFLEIETPILTKATPEGARDYLVPSRVHLGNFYALPQSPQQYKQLLMVAGIEKYFQIARCFRDEDTRGDRQPEFTQLDLEMSFVEQEDILNLVEELMIMMVKTVCPEKRISKIPFPRITYKEAMEKYNSDKPDLRKDKNDKNELAFAWVLDFPMFALDKEGNIASEHHPFCSIHKEDQEKFMKGEDLLSIRANSYDLVLNGYEISSGSIRIHNAEIQKKVFEILRLSEEEIMNKFAHIIEAFQYGAPPHGGIAPGIDRLLMILSNEPNIREVIAFPKTGEGRDPMMNSPAEASEEHLKELGIEIIKN